MFLKIFFVGFFIFFLSVLLYLRVEFKVFNLTEKLTLKVLAKRLWEEKAVLIGGLIPIIQYILAVVILFEVLSMKKKEQAAVTENLGINLNKMYECTNPDCQMICREYHLIKNSAFDIGDNCPFCKSKEYSIVEMGEKYDSVEKLSFAEAIPKNKERDFLIQTKEKWLEIERKQVELESLKLSYELEKRQMDNYLRLNSNKADKIISEYEEKLANLQEEYESFSKTIEDDIIAYLYGDKS